MTIAVPVGRTCVMVEVALGTVVLVVVLVIVDTAVDVVVGSTAVCV